jgi:hypothetical protein
VGEVWLGDIEDYSFSCGARISPLPALCRPIIGRGLVPLYALSPAAYQRIVDDLVNLVGAVLGDVQQRGGQGLAQAVASDASTVLVEDDKDIAARVQAIAPQGPPPSAARRILGQRCRFLVQDKHRRPPASGQQVQANPGAISSMHGACATILSTLNI